MEETIATRAYSSRDYLEEEVANRARHQSAEDVRTTCSFARAERLLGREYHGRFLIELLQNAADASRGADKVSGRSRVEVQITEGPALLVANQGAPMSAEVVIESLGHIGASTKAEGEAIGYKGIGFKSVLELTLTPEIYSGLQQSSPDLAVGFDPEMARKKIRGDSTGWDGLVAGVQGLDPEDPFSAVPVLRYPYWIEQPPKEVAELKEKGFDTVVRLPFDGRFAERLNLDGETWLRTVRDALGDVSDQILLLLGCFEEVRLEDRLALWEDVIAPEWEQAPVEIGRGASREVVQVWRNGDLSSRWRLYRRALPDYPHLAGEAAVGIRIDGDPNIETVHPAVADQPSTPFHLFFPTRIPSGLPFLLHAYFEVDAARTGFYRGSAERNQAMLDELAELARIAVADAVNVESLDLASLVNLVAEAGEPEAPLARKLRSDVLGLLDDVAWIPLEDGDRGKQSELPINVFSAKPDLVRRIGGTFPPSYIRRQTGLGLPDNGLSDAALQLMMARSSEAIGLWETVGLLCRPGESPPWDGRLADSGFRSLIDLFAALDIEHHDRTRELLNELRGDRGSRLIPTVGAGSDRILLPIPDPEESVPGRRSRLVMAGLGSSEGPPLVPPDDLDIAFLPDGLLSETERDQAKPLEVRPFTVDNVLDRLGGIEDARVDGESLVGFLWKLLVRERVSGFGTRRSVERASVFNPSEWFWCQPGRARQDETARLRQQRERYLSAVPLPCRDGNWRQAGRIAFGADWAGLLERSAAGKHTATQHRITAYRAMERVSPGPEALLASPEVVLRLLDDGVFRDGSPASGDEEPLDDEPLDDEPLDERQRDAHRHAFLMRLGVWEVPPIEAYESRIRNREERFPWTGWAADEQLQMIEQAGGWRFGLNGWAGERHHDVYLAEDYRFLWPLEEMARRDVSSLVRALRLGAKLYDDRSSALVFCTGCNDAGGSHRAWRHSSSDDGYPSSLAVQLKSEPWVPCTLDGNPLEAPSKPESVWWHPKPPVGAALRQSPWRLVPLCSPAEGLDEDLRRLVGISALDDAPAEEVEDLLSELRTEFEERRLPADPLTSGSARRAFVGLHRLAYERLSELSSRQPETAALLDCPGVLCELGEQLVYRPRTEARHDDGRFSAYARHFALSIPFVMLPRDWEAAARRLGVAPFRLELTRLGEDEGQDVTDDVQNLHGDRIAEMLAIMVHHSLGTQTLDPESQQFEERARRIRNLRIRKLDDLVVDAAAEGTNDRVTLGKGSNQDLFLETPTSVSPVLFHDLSGDGWQDRLRRKIAPYFAMVLENQAYAHTFALFLQANGDAEREEFLLALGISADEVEDIKTRVGVVSEEERRRYERWFASILTVLGVEPVDLDTDDLVFRLAGAGIPDGVAARLVELGGGEAVRRESGKDSALRLLAKEARVDLQDLHAELLERGDSGLDLRVSRNAFSRWLDTSRRRLSAVLATSWTPDVAKETVRSLGPPPELGLSLDPELADLLWPVVEALRSAGMDADASSLADNPANELAYQGGFDTVERLDEKAKLIFNEEEQRRFLRERAVQWRREIRLLAVLARTGPAEEPRTAIRAHDESVANKLPHNPSSPADLRDALHELLGEHPTLAGKISESLVATVDAEAPDRDQLMEWARQYGVATDRLASVQRALDAPRFERARKLKERSDGLADRGVRPVTPPGFEEIPSPPLPSPDDGPKPVGRIKIGEGHDRRKRELGDEGEQWALASAVGTVMDLDVQARDSAIDDIVALLGRFEGLPVDEALSHAAGARMHDLDDEERIDELSSLLHVSQYSDAFGFDVIGWLPQGPSGEGQAVCLEVKSSGGEGFHLSRNEWALAEKLHGEGAGGQYAVLVVRRGKARGVPAAMDLLGDPVKLVEAGRLRREVDGYQIAYRISDS